ncbi:ion channel [Halomonas mongoliensis]|uniref:ion channel n=1 Tax=Halomonas mongoliensis TaxID=321265 RepID=UPI00403ABB20
MLSHGVPWQAALGHAFMSVIIFSVMMVMSLASGFFGWYSIFTAVFLVAGFFIIASLLPLLLNLSRSFFWLVFALFFLHIVVTIISFAMHYKYTGLLGDNGEFSPDFWDALYFSITTFTTLGYGDFQPLPEYRLTTSVEALFGMISMAVGASLIWLWCQENMVPKEMAFFDGNRRHKGDLTVTRIRVRTITGKERKLKDWALAPEEGESYYYDQKRQEWLLVTKDTELPDNTLVMGRKSADEDA